EQLIMRGKCCHRLGSTEANEIKVMRESWTEVSSGAGLTGRQNFQAALQALVLRRRDIHKFESVRLGIAIAHTCVELEAHIAFGNIEGNRHQFSGKNCSVNISAASAFSQIGQLSSQQHLLGGRTTLWMQSKFRRYRESGKPPAYQNGRRIAE